MARRSSSLGGGGPRFHGRSLKLGATRRSTVRMRFRLPVVLVLALALAPPLGRHRRRRRGPKPEIAFVTSKGFPRRSAKTFRPDAPLTQAELAELVARLQERPSSVPATRKRP